jgi:hypothetical protein
MESEIKFPHVLFNIRQIEKFLKSVDFRETYILWFLCYEAFCRKMREILSDVL